MAFDLKTKRYKAVTDLLIKQTDRPWLLAVKEDQGLWFSEEFDLPRQMGLLQETIGGLAGWLVREMVEHDGLASARDYCRQFYEQMLTFTDPCFVEIMDGGEEAPEGADEA